MAHITRVAKNEQQKEIIKLFNNLQGRHSLWKLWGDFVVMLACSISNAVDVEHRQEREEMFKTISSAYTEKELDSFATIYARLVDAYERDPDQDLLGELYMGLELGNDRNGQFFTPYDVCRCMAEINIGNADALLADKGWIAVNDSAVGAGALLIAFANTCKRKNINYQMSVLFTAQELDFTTACMCYIQLSILGCPGYVYVGNTITDPCVSLDGRALIPKPSKKLWYTPMYFHQIWHYRRVWAQMDMLFHTASPAKPTQEPEKIESTVEDIPSKDEEIELLANENGQLMLF